MLGQGLNRYSYGMNNPFSGTDPSGFAFSDSDNGLGISMGWLGGGFIGAGLSMSSSGSTSNWGGAGSPVGGLVGITQAARDFRDSTWVQRYQAPEEGPGGSVFDGGMSQGGMGAKTGGASQGTSPGGPRLQIQTDQNGRYVYQQLPPELAEELGPILQPLLQQGGLSINDIRVVARPLEGDPGRQENGRVIQIDPRGLDAADERGLVAHEIVHAVQRRLLGTTSLVDPGTPGIDLLGDLEHATWGRNARNLGLWYRFGLNQSLTTLNVIDPRYPIEATATHVQRVVLDAF
jgi:hypothetical protein